MKLHWILSSDSVFHRTLKIRIEYRESRVLNSDPRAGARGIRRARAERAWASLQFREAGRELAQIESVDLTSGTLIHGSQFRKIQSSVTITDQSTESRGNSIFEQPVGSAQVEA